MRAFLGIVLCAMVAGVVFAQQTAPTPAPTTPTAPTSQSRDAGNPDSAGHGTVLFERSLPAPDDLPDQAPTVAPANATLKTRDGAAAATPSQPPAEPAATGPTATDAERSAPTFTAYDLDVRLVPAESSIAVRASITVRNDGAKPLARLPLQISSSLAWLGIRSANQKLAFAQQMLDSDTDHTGAVNEALVILPTPLAPADTITLEVLYSGTIPVNAQRLERIGAPHDQAVASDWDRIAANFTGLRGFGDALWCPAASPALALGDGARLFNGVGAWKQRQSQATVSMRVQVEYRGDPPNIAVLDGQVVPPTSTTSTPSTESKAPDVSSRVASAAPEKPIEEDTDLATPHTATFVLPATILGFQAPNLFIFSGNTEEESSLRLWFRSEDAANTQAYFAGAALVRPLFAQWFGNKPQRPLTLVDLPESADQPFDAGATLFLPLRAGEPSQLATLFSSAQTAAWFRSPRVWMSEGMAQFMGMLWVERTMGRPIALEQLEAQRSGLALAEPETPGDGLGQNLNSASAPAYYRTKAAYVWWMLRGMVGDQPLQAALRAYRADRDTQPEYFERLLETASGKDLRWFFADWVYHDLGLPDLSIAAVVPRKNVATGDYLVAVEVANAGYAAAEVPVTLHSGSATVTDRLLVPARASATTRIVIQGAPDSATVNDGSVPEIRVTVHRRNIVIGDQP